MGGAPGASGPKKNSTLAITSLVLGILGLTLCCGTWLISLAAIITGVMGKKEIKAKPDALTGDMFANIGIGTGAFGLLVSLAGALYYIFVVLWSSL